MFGVDKIRFVFGLEIIHFESVESEPHVVRLLFLYQIGFRHFSLLNCKVHDEKTRKVTEFGCPINTIYKYSTKWSMFWGKPGLRTMSSIRNVDTTVEGALWGKHRSTQQFFVQMAFAADTDGGRRQMATHSHPTDTHAEFRINREKRLPTNNTGNKRREVVTAPLSHHPNTRRRLRTVNREREAVVPAHRFARCSAQRFSSTRTMVAGQSDHVSLSSNV